MNRYPMLNMLARSGVWASIVGGLIPLIGLPLCLGMEPRIVGAGFVLGAIAFVVVRSYIELIQLITDMLLPK